MIQVRKAGERGKTSIDWLDSWHSFSFGSYHDSAHMGFGPLRVINDDIIKPAAGFGSHPHRDMEIITYVMEGALQHKDSLGNGSMIVPGDVQYMSAGSGIVHSEYNPQPDKRVHLLQIWIMPDKHGLNPAYQQKNFSEVRVPGKLTLLVSRDGREGSLQFNQDASMAVLDLDVGQNYDYAITPGKLVWVHVAKGNVMLGDIVLAQGDGVAVRDEAHLQFIGKDKAEILIFDLPK